MQGKRKESSKTSAVKDFVTVAFAEDMELARQYKELLEDNQIEVQIKRQPDMAESGFSDIAIAVPEESLDEAHHLIAERASYDDFFDMTFDDERQGFDVYECESDEDDELF
jgi:hypothetical protein